MDALIALLVIIAIINALGSNKKRKQGAQRGRAQRRAAQGAGTPQTVAAQRVRPQAARPIIARPSAPPPPAAPQVTVLQPNAAPHGGEGTVSTQGESAAEHAEHLRRAAAERAQHKKEREAAYELRAANREKLRAAVVMSEVLNKPVALRPRAGLHR